MSGSEPMLSPNGGRFPDSFQVPDGFSQGPSNADDDDGQAPPFVTDKIEPVMGMSSSWATQTVTATLPTGILPPPPAASSPSMSSPTSMSAPPTSTTPSDPPIQTQGASGVFDAGSASSSSSPDRPSALPSSSHTSRTVALAVGITVPVVVLLIVAVVLLLFWKKKWPFRERKPRGSTDSKAMLTGGGSPGFFGDAESNPQMTQYSGGIFHSEDPTPREIAPNGTVVPGAAAAAAAKMLESERRWGSRSNVSTAGETVSTTKSFGTNLLAGLGRSVFGRRRANVYPEVAYLYDPPVRSETSLAVQSSTAKQGTTGSQPPVIKKQVASGPLPIMESMSSRKKNQAKDGRQARGAADITEPNYGVIQTSFTEQLPVSNATQNRGQPEMIENTEFRDYAHPLTQTRTAESKGPSVTEHPIFKISSRPELDRNTSSMSTIPNADPSKERVPIMLDESSIPSPTNPPTVERRAPTGRIPSDSTIVASSNYSSPPLVSSSNYSSPPSISPQSPPSPPSTQRPQPRLITSFDDATNKKVSVISPASPLLPTAISENVREATTATFTVSPPSRRSKVPRVAIRKPTPSTGSPVSTIAPLSASSPPTMSPRLRKHRTLSLDKPLPALPALPPDTTAVPNDISTHVIFHEPEDDPVPQPPEPAWQNWRAEVEREAARIWAP